MSRLPLLKYWHKITFKWYIASAREIKIIIGAGSTSHPGWYSTDKDILDITQEMDFETFFSTKKIKYIVAEHVFEHLTESEILFALHLIHKYSSFDVTMRVAVPDGFHSDSGYIERVRPGGSGKGAHDHKHLFTYLSLIELFYKAGFTGNPLDYFDEHGIFHHRYKNDGKGYISRSIINDPRNKNDIPLHTSLIIDFTKVV